MNSTAHRFSCFVIGAQARLIRCTEILLEKGHEVCGIISNDPETVDWATRRQLACLTPGSQLRAALAEHTFDYLFSINNFYIVPHAILDQPSKMAINFHDSPLPRYAGVNATSWALINGEKQHGVTWHSMTDRIDAGRILKQVRFDLPAEETVMTLNGRCYQESLASFRQLVDELASGSIQPITQSLEHRSYYARWQRPRAACTIDWTHPAAQIESLFRGLDYGRYENPLGLPKLFLGDRVVVARRISTLKSSQSSLPATAPGTILKLDGDSICVATVTLPVRLRDFLTADGQPIATGAFLTSAGFREGDVLPSVPDDQAASITKIHTGFAQHESYWQRKLGALEPIEIPCASSPSTSPSQNCHCVLLEPSPQELLKLSSFPAILGDMLLAAFSVYLGRISGREEFDIGLRTPWLQQQINGNELFFAPYVPLRLQFDPGQSLDVVCGQVSEQVRATLRHGSFARDLPMRSPSLSKVPRAARLAVNVDRVSNLADGASQHDCDLLLVIPDDGRQVKWCYDSTVFDAQQITDMQGQFAALLRDFAAHPDRPSGALCVTNERERQWLAEWNHAKATTAPTRCIHELLESQVSQRPAAVAVTCGTESITYGDLDQRANRLAIRLRQQGVRPDMVVGLHMHRSIDLLVGMVGILKAGGAYLPLDPNYPRDRLEFMLQDSGASVVVTQSSLQEELPSQDRQTVVVDDIGGELPDSMGEPAGSTTKNSVAPHNLAYVIYTSGSTGTPKGVMVSHANVVRLFASTEAWFGFDCNDVWTLFHSYAFDFSVWEIWGALLYGGKLVVVPYEVSRSPDQFRELLSRERVTILNQTPSAFRQLIVADGNADSQHDAYCLRTVIFGGEALEPHTLKPWVARHGDRQPRLVNMYGITETTVHVTYQPITASDVDHERRSVIGIPIPDLQVYVLDGQYQPVPKGVTGELYVGGAGVARGYLGRPDLTDQRFVADPFAGQANSRLYKTGDLARFGHDGRLEYCGRDDQQVQVRGFRIEPGEIEQSLQRHESVSQAIVIVRQDQADDQRLIAYCLPQGPAVIDPTMLRKFLTGFLPDYMIPQSFVAITEVPLTANGKLDRNALPNPQLLRRQMDDYVAPRSELEIRIAACWQELLGIDPVGVHDNFFEIGGHSLLMPPLVDRLAKLFDKPLSVVDIFRYPTVAKLAEAMGKTEGTSSERFDQVRRLAHKRTQTLHRRRIQRKANEARQ